MKRSPSEKPRAGTTGCREDLVPPIEGDGLVLGKVLEPEAVAGLLLHVEEEGDTGRDDEPVRRAIGGGDAAEGAGGLRGRSRADHLVRSRIALAVVAARRVAPVDRLDGLLGDEAAVGLVLHARTPSAFADSPAQENRRISGAISLTIPWIESSR